MTNDLYDLCLNQWGESKEAKKRMYICVYYMRMRFYVSTFIIYSCVLDVSCQLYEEMQVTWERNET